MTRSPKVTVYLPEDEYDALAISESTGDINLKNVLAKSDTGDIHVPEEVSGGKCKITTSTGDIRISFE